MADRFPLIVDSTTGTVKELPNSDNLNLSGSAIVGVTSIGVDNIFSSRIELSSNGSSLNPIIDFGSDTGMFQSAEESISIGVGGTERIFINPVGNIGFSTNVGLGTTSTSIDLGIESAKRTSSLTRAKPPVGIGTSAATARSLQVTQTSIVQQNTTGDIFRFTDESGSILADSSNSVTGIVFINCYHGQAALPNTGTEGIESYVFSLNHTSDFTSSTNFVAISTAIRSGVNTSFLTNSIQLANDVGQGAVKITATTRNFDKGFYTVTFVGQLSRRFIGTAFGN